MRFGSLDALRGLCAIAIVLRHSAFTTGNTSVLFTNFARPMVDFFFVLSGFVMAHAYKQRITDGLDFRSYALARLGRVYPLHLFTLGLWLPYVAAVAIVHHFAADGLDPLVRNNAFSFLTNVLMIQALGVHDSMTWNYPSWAVCVLFWTYLVFFAVVRLLGRRLSWSVALLLAGSAYAALYGLTDDNLSSTYDFAIVRCFGGFFAGVFVYEVQRRFAPRASSTTWSAVEIVVLLIGYGAITASISGKAAQLLGFASYIPVVYVLSIQSSGVVSRALHVRPLQRLGRLSYSVYLSHALIAAVAFKIYRHILGQPATSSIGYYGQVVVHAVTPYGDVINLGLVATVIGFAVLTHRYIEEPWRLRTRAPLERSTVAAESVTRLDLPT